MFSADPLSKNAMMMHLSCLCPCLFCTPIVYSGIFDYTRKKANPAATTRLKRLTDSELGVDPLLPVDEAEPVAEAVGVDERFSVVDAVASGRMVAVDVPLVPVGVAVAGTEVPVLEAVAATVEDSHPEVATVRVVEQSSQVSASRRPFTHSAAESV
jgi:hypothetical protein